MLKTLDVFNSLGVVGPLWPMCTFSYLTQSCSGCRGSEEPLLVKLSAHFLLLLDPCPVADEPQLIRCCRSFGAPWQGQLVLLWAVEIAVGLFPWSLFHHSVEDTLM